MKLKSIIPFLVFSLMLIGCKKDDPQVEPEIENISPELSLQEDAIEQEAPKQ